MKINPNSLSSAIFGIVLLLSAIIFIGWFVVYGPHDKETLAVLIPLTILAFFLYRH